MSDYIRFIDFNTIKLADLASEIGDYQCALDNYSKALKTLRNYQGDRMQPAMMAKEIEKKINDVNSKIIDGQSILKFSKWNLTKSSFVKGNQCLKYLYLDKHKKQEKTPVSKEKQMLFNQGHTFEELVRNTDFPDGINVKESVGNFAYFSSYTKHLLNSSNRQVIYEATIIEKDVLVMCDIIVKNHDGTVEVYEVKLNSEINDAILADLEIQYVISKIRFGTNLKSFNLILRKENTNDQWEIIDLTDKLALAMEAVLAKINQYKTVLLDNEPAIPMGEHCNSPYPCEFIEYCKKTS